jgi:hypothetical protein
MDSKEEKKYIYVKSLYALLIIYLIKTINLLTTILLKNEEKCL